jgi:hypothetical protein
MEFLSLLTKGQPQTGLLGDACDWFTMFIETKCDMSWATLLQPNLTGIDHTSQDILNRDYSPVYHVLIKSASYLKSSPELSLTSVVDDLVNEGLLHDVNDDTREHLWQAVFALIGWISRLICWQSVQI